MIGVDLNFNVDMSLFSNVNITDEKDIMAVKENVGKLSRTICEILNKELSRHPLDEFSVDLMSVNYIEPEDIEFGVEILNV